MVVTSSACQKRSKMIRKGLTCISVIGLVIMLSACSASDALNAIIPSSGYTRHADISYGTNPRQALDVYEPTVAAPAGGRTVVVFFYGGSWLGKPALLVLDEVSSGVDPIGRRHLRELLGEVRQQGTTIFFSSHELDEVAQLCDRVILIYGGRVVDEHVMDAHLRSGIGSPLETYFVETMEQAAKKAA